MQACNPAAVPIDTGTKLVKDEDEEGVDTTEFKQLVGSLRYVCNSRPDICYAVGLVSRFMECPKQSHMMVAKKILRYLRGTTDFGILFPTYSSSSEGELIGFSDSDWCGDRVDRRSTMGYVFKFLDGPISWSSKKQSVVALSSCEAEYIAACSAACQALWLRSLLEEMHLWSGGVMQLLVDNQSAINLAKNPISHGRSKHIETKYHFLRDQVTKGKLELIFVKSELQ